jgi:hypothetical protein
MAGNGYLLLSLSRTCLKFAEQSAKTIAADYLAPQEAPDKFMKNYFELMGRDWQTRAFMLGATICDPEARQDVNPEGLDN